eukprot:317977-Chlamydomonas_euryale.AAC.3
MDGVMPELECDQLPRFKTSPRTRPQAQGGVGGSAPSKKGQRARNPSFIAPCRHTRLWSDPANLPSLNLPCLTMF